MCSLWLVDSLSDTTYDMSVPCFSERVDGSVGGWGLPLISPAAHRHDAACCGCGVTAWSVSRFESSLGPFTPCHPHHSAVSPVTLQPSLNKITKIKRKDRNKILVFLCWCRLVWSSVSYLWDRWFVSLLPAGHLRTATVIFKSSIVVSVRLADRLEFLLIWLNHLLLLISSDKSSVQEKKMFVHTSVLYIYWLHRWKKHGEAHQSVKAHLRNEEFHVFMVSWRRLSLNPAYGA